VGASSLFGGKEGGSSSKTKLLHGKGRKVATLGGRGGGKKSDLNPPIFWKKGKHLLQPKTTGRSGGMDYLKDEISLKYSIRRGGGCSFDKGRGSMQGLNPGKEMKFFLYLEGGEKGKGTVLFAPRKEEFLLPWKGKGRFRPTKVESFLKYQIG